MVRETGRDKAHAAHAYDQQARGRNAIPPLAGPLDALARDCVAVLHSFFEAPPEPLDSLEAERARLWILLRYVDNADVLAVTARALWWHAQIPTIPLPPARFSAAR